MHNLNINGNWHKKRKKLQQNFSELTNEDLQYSKGKENQLVKRIQQRLDVPRNIAQKLIRYS